MSGKSYVMTITETGIILFLRPANARRRYNVTSSLIGWAKKQNDPCWNGSCIELTNIPYLPTWVRCGMSMFYRQLTIIMYHKLDYMLWILPTCYGYCPHGCNEKSIVCLHAVGMKITCSQILSRFHWQFLTHFKISCQIIIANSS